MLTRRALNRATLARQGLLARVDATPLMMIERLVGMQAQNPRDPYFALAARLVSFVPAELEALYWQRAVTRLGLMRATLHLVSAADAWALGAHMHDVMVRVFGGTAYAKATREVDRERLCARVKALVEAEPMPRAAIARALSEHYPGVPLDALGNAATYLQPLVQVPPRGAWTATSQATWTTVSHWLGPATLEAPPIETIVRRYLAAFGPASVSDMRSWCGVTELRAAFARVPELVAFTHAGVELYDLADAPRPDEDTPAPPRFLPEYDNVLLGHADRSRFFVPGVRPKGFVGNLLVDGVFAGSWTCGDEAIEVTPHRKLTKAEIDDVRREGGEMLARLRPGTTTKVVFLAA